MGTQPLGAPGPCQEGSEGLSRPWEPCWVRAAAEALFAAARAGPDWVRSVVQNAPQRRNLRSPACREMLIVCEGAAKSPQYSRERGVIGIVPIVLAAAAQPAGLGTGTGQGRAALPAPSSPMARDGIRARWPLPPGWIPPVLSGRGGHSVSSCAESVSFA